MSHPQCTSSIRIRNVQTGLAVLIGILSLMGTWVMIWKSHQEDDSATARFSHMRNDFLSNAPPRFSVSPMRLSRLQSAVNKSLPKSTPSMNTHAATTLSTLNTTVPMLQRNATHIPSWLQDYFTWHAKARRSIDHDIERWQDYRYLVLRCLAHETKCAGTADRLLALPGALVLAHQSQRILLWYWERPAPLERFLVPPPGGLDWRVSEALRDKLDLHNNKTLWKTGAKNVTFVVGALKRSQQRVLGIRNLLGNYWDQARRPHEAGRDAIFRSVWDRVFVPSPPVHALVNRHLENLQLQPHLYVAAHVRSLYVDNMIDHHGERVALRCARTILLQQQQQEVPLQDTIYFTSDSADTTQHAVTFAQQHQWNITVRSSTTPPVHLDRGHDFLTRYTHDWQRHDLDGFYEIFVDLLLLGNSRCVAYGAGGFGFMGSLLSYVPSCGHNYRRRPCV
jgi:hypothetical protein